MADHNDPNAVNSIFSDIDVSAADLYDIFGFPSDDAAGGEKVVIALTLAAVPQTGVFDGDMLYRIQIAPDRRLERSGKDDVARRARCRWYPYRSNSRLGHVELLKQKLPDAREGVHHMRIGPMHGHRGIVVIKGTGEAQRRPQFYHVPHAMPDLRELKIPKTFLVIDGPKPQPR
jgi:hypothetical protein